MDGEIHSTARASPAGPRMGADRSSVMGILDRFTLDGKVAIVTGASSGLGVAVAVAMAQAGADVAIGARRIDKLEHTRGLVEATGRHCVAVQTDITSVEQCQALADRTMEEFGRVDVLVNNAGVGGEYHTATEDPPEHFRSMIDLHINGNYWMTQAAARVMGPGSSIINISSVMALTTAKMPAAGYSAGKAGLLGMTRDLAAQFGVDLGIRVNALVLGVFPSEQTANYSENYRKAVIKAKIPAGRFGEPEDMAATCVFLASDASAYITGVTLPVDGGVLIN
jgi:NAD(P)-dependent dehydrogenase (short-subunit alcohol dehydrogenase family)